MSTTFTSLTTPTGEQRELMRGIRACVTKISTLRAGRVKNAVKALEKITHRSPLLSFLCPISIIELYDRLEDRLEGVDHGRLEGLVKRGVKDIEAYWEAEDELAQAEARVEFYELQALNAQKLFVYTMIYEKKCQKAKDTGQAFSLDYATWLRTQPIVTFDLGLLGECLKRKEEERKKVQKADVKEHQWELVREIADSLKGKRIVDDGDKEILGL